MSGRFLHSDPTRPPPTFFPAPPGMFGGELLVDGLEKRKYWFPVAAVRVSLFWSAKEELWSQRVSYILANGEEADLVLFPDGRLLDVYSEPDGDTVMWPSLAEYMAEYGGSPATGNGEEMLYVRIGP